MSMRTACRSHACFLKPTQKRVRLYLIRCLICAVQPLAADPKPHQFIHASSLPRFLFPPHCRDMVRLQTEAAANLTVAVTALQERLETRLTSLKDTISNVRKRPKTPALPRPSRCHRSPMSPRPAYTWGHTHMWNGTRACVSVACWRFSLRCTLKPPSRRRPSVSGIDSRRGAGVAASPLITLSGVAKLAAEQTNEPIIMLPVYLL